MKRILSLLVVFTLVVSFSTTGISAELTLPSLPGMEPEPVIVEGVISITTGWNLIAMPVLPVEPYTVRQFIKDVEPQQLILEGVKPEEKPGTEDPNFLEPITVQPRLDGWKIGTVAVYKNGRYETYPKEGVTYNMVPGEAYFVNASYSGPWKMDGSKPRRVVTVKGRLLDNGVSLNLNRGWNGCSTPKPDSFLKTLSDELVAQNVKAAKIAFWNNSSRPWPPPPAWEVYDLPFDGKLGDNISPDVRLHIFLGREIRPNQGFFLLLPDENGLYIPGLDSVPEPPIVEPPLIPVKKTLITDRPGSKYNLDIYENKIACKEHRGKGFDIYVYDVGTGQETMITGGQQTPGSSVPAIYEDMIAFQSGSGSTNLHMYDLANGQTTLITNAQSDQRYPDFFENKIVWEDARNGSCDIYMCEVFKNSQGQIELIERQITDDPGSQRFPVVYGSLIAWEDYRNGNADIYMYNLLTGEERRITSDPADQADPVIFENTIVWTDKRNGNEDIYMYDLSTGTETAVCTAPGSQVYPAIHAGVIAWYDRRNSAGEIHLYFTATGQEYRTGCTPIDPRFLDIYKNKIAWVGSQDGRHAIYIGEFGLKLRQLSIDE